MYDPLFSFTYSGDMDDQFDAKLISSLIYCAPLSEYSINDIPKTPVKSFREYVIFAFVSMFVVYENEISNDITINSNWFTFEYVMYENGFHRFKISYKHPSIEYSSDALEEIPEECKQLFHMLLSPLK